MTPVRVHVVRTMLRTSVCVAHRFYVPPPTSTARFLLPQVYLLMGIGIFGMPLLWDWYKKEVYVYILPVW